LTKQKNEDKHIQRLARQDGVQLISDTASYRKYRDIVDEIQSNNSVTRPLQVYFLDPLSYLGLSISGLDDADNKKRVETLIGEKWEYFLPRRLFFLLLKKVREYILSTLDDDSITQSFSSFSSGANWGEEYDHESVDLSTISSEESQKMVQMVSKWQARMRVFLKRENPLSSLFNTNKEATHTLRRLYVCYSYLRFSADKTKEVQYARYVLRHKTLEVSTRYLTLRISRKMTGNADKTGFVEIYNGMKQQVVNLKRQLDGIQQEDSPGEFKRVRLDSDIMIQFRRIGGGVAAIAKLPRAPRRSRRDGVAEGRERLIQRGIQKGTEMIEKGVKVTLSSLRKLGVNHTIVREVFNRVNQ